MTKTINLINTVAGSGKSTQARSSIISSSNKTLVIVPSINLCKEWEEKLVESDADISIKIIYRDNTNPAMSTSTTQRFIEEMNVSDARVVITTHATFNLAVKEGFKLLHDYDLYIDEAMNTHEIHDFRFFKCSYEYIKNYVDFKDTKNPDLYRVVANRTLKIRMKGIADGNDLQHDSTLDDKDGKFKKLFTLLLSNGHDTYISKETVEKFESIDSDIEQETSECGFVSVVHSSAFEQFTSVTILSAFFHLTESYHVLKFLGYNFHTIEETLSHSRENIHIHYYLNKNFTARIRDTFKNRAGKFVIDYMIDDALSTINDNKYIACVNDSTAHKLKGNFEIVNAPHGLNDYDTVCYAMKFQSANANSSVASTFLSVFNITRDIIDRDRNILLAYQFVMRTCIRNRNAEYASKPVHLFVTDKRHADFLHDVFTNATVVKHDVPQIISILSDNNITDTIKNVIPRSAVTAKYKFEKKVKNQERYTDKAAKKYHEIMDEYYPTHIKQI
jgi:hypothetical protein